MRFLVGFLFCTALIFHARGQSPQGINYQGVARDTEGKPLISQNIAVRISILKDGAVGDTEFAETHAVKTNSFGLFMLVIGQGKTTVGSFQFISWAVGTKWLQIEMDPAGGNSFQLLGSQQLMSVPYAFYATYSGNGLTAGQGIKIQNNQVINTGDSDNSSTNELITALTLGNDKKLKITEAGTTKEVDLSSLTGSGSSQNLGSVLSIGNDATGQKITNLASPTTASDAATKQYVDSHTDADANASNEIQDLSKTGNTLSLSGDASTIDLSPYLDNTDNQDLTLAGNTLSLTNDATPINLSPYLDNTDSQSLTTTSSGTNRSINISGGSGVTIDVADNDNSITNELQNLGNSVSGTQRTISITGGTSTTIDVADNDNNSTNEIQNLGNTVSGTQRTITISGGTSTTIDVADNDNDVSNELQNLTQVLTRGQNAGGLQIQNLGTPASGTDATTKTYVDNAIATAIATNYAFKVSYSFSYGGVPVTNQLVTFASEVYDDFSVVASNRFTVPSNGAGYYNLFVDGTSSTTPVALKIRLNGTTTYTIKRYTNPLSTFNINDTQTLMLKLTTGDFVELVVDSLTAGDQVNGVLFGYKL